MLMITIVAGNFTLTVTQGGTTTGAKVYGSGNGTAQLNDTLFYFYDTTLGEWVWVP